MIISVVIFLVFGALRYGMISDEDAQKQIFDLINEERKSRGLALFSHNSILQTLADERASEMNQYDIISHDRPEGKTSIVEHLKNLDCKNIGEDVSGTRNPKQLISDINNSPLHLAPIISQARYAAVAVETNHVVILTC